MAELISNYPRPALRYSTGGNHLDLIVNIETFARNLVSTHGYVDVFLVALALHAGLLVKLGSQRAIANSWQSVDSISAC